MGAIERELDGVLVLVQSLCSTQEHFTGVSRREEVPKRFAGR